MVLLLLLFISVKNDPDGGLKCACWASDHMIETQMVLSGAQHIGWNTYICVKGHISPVAFVCVCAAEK